MKPEGEGWCSCAPDSLLHQTFAQTEVLPLRHKPITLPVPPETTVLPSALLQPNTDVGFSESGGQRLPRRRGMRKTHAL